MTKPYILDKINGLRVILYPIKGLPAVKANLVIRAGSSYEEGKDWGAFHFIEHLTFHQTKRFKNKLELELFKEEYGLNNNAGTGREDISYYTYGPSSSFKQALELLYELVFEPVIPEEVMEREIEVIRQEYNDKWDSPHNRFQRAFEEQHFGKSHRYTRDGMGQPEYIASLSRDDLRELHGKYFVNENCVLSLTGDFGVEEAKKMVRDIFVGNQGGLLRPRRGEIKSGEREFIYRDDVQQDTAVLSWLVPGFMELPLRERFAMWIAGYIVGGSTRSKLFRRLREELGLVYRCGASRKLNPYAGYFEVWSSNSPQSTSRVFEEMRKETYGFVGKPIEEKMYRRSLNYLKSNISLSFDSIGRISESITYNYFWEKKVYLPDDDIKLLLTISEKEVREVLGRYVRPENEYVSLMTSRKKTGS